MAAASPVVTNDDVGLADDQAFRRRELELREATLRLEQRKFYIPPIIAAIVAALGAYFVHQRQYSATIEVERQKAEAAYVLESIKTGDQEVAKRNLLFLVNLGFLRDPEGKIRALEKSPEQTPVLPVASAGSPRIELSVNGQHRLVTLPQGERYWYRWSAVGATACQMTSPVVSGIATSGEGGPIGPETNRFYPSSERPVVITIVCTNGSSNAIDSIVVRR